MEENKIVIVTLQPRESIIKLKAKMKEFVTRRALKKSEEAKEMQKPKD